jgi:pyruvate/2-oxoglutarate dehydrogenase complex dihydrolipoamide dehydrogenase (E3) component
MGAKVALVERDLLGGVCLNTGCISSKAIIRTSRLYAEMRTAEHYGARRPDDIQVDFPAAMERMRRIRARVVRRVSAQELTAKGIDVFSGEGRFTGPDTVAVNGDAADRKSLRFRRALLRPGRGRSYRKFPGSGKRAISQTKMSSS